MKEILMRKRLLALCLIGLISFLVLGCSPSQNGSPPDGEIPEPEEDIVDDPIEEDPLTEEEKAQIAYEEAKKEREALEEERKNSLGEFYVPLPDLGSELNADRFLAKGLFLTGSTAGNSVDDDKVDIYVDYINALKTGDTATINQLSGKLSELNRLEKIIGIAVATEINAVVIDVKDDNGRMTYRSNIQLVDEVDGNREVRIKDVKELMVVLEKYDIYPIARVVAFKDKNFAYARPDHAIQLLDGGVWHDYSGTPWVNPFDQYVWDYNIAIAKEAALMGFKEIQFDYVRFPDNAAAYNPITNFPGRDGRRKDEAIGDFLEYAMEELKDYGVTIAADVFGIITRTWADSPEDIGQTWLEISPNTDIICPMVYPSHYGANWYGYEVPDAHPYGVIRGSMMEAIEKNAAVKNEADIRPWLQDFTATWVEGYIYYGFNEVRQQIIAAKELGIEGYMIWNPSNVYDPRAYIPTETEKNTQYPLETGDRDYLDRTPADALQIYLRSERNNIYSRVFLLTPIADREDDFDTFYDRMTSLSIELIDYDVLEYQMVSKDQAEVTINYQYRLSEENDLSYLEGQSEVWTVIKEKGIWKVVRGI